jgi:hypothetical protein
MDIIDTGVSTIKEEFPSVVGIRAQVMQNGKLIYSADKFKCDLFETEALTDYLRFNEERKEILEDIKSRGTVFGNHG